MLLAIDVGNTNLVFALVEGKQVVARWRIATDPRRTGDEYAVWLWQLIDMQKIEREQIDSIIISTVVPRALHNLEVLAKKYFDIEPLIAGQGEADWPFPIDVEEPRSLGADRAVNAVAAHNRWKGDLILIDFGTATTFDYIDYTGTYKGGCIAPGVNLSLDALVSAAAKLPRIAIEEPNEDSVIGRNTESQMHIGIFWGYLGMMEGMVKRMKAEIGRPVTVVATGGLANVFSNHCEIFDVVEHDLTIEGLALLARQAGATF